MEYPTFIYLLSYYYHYFETINETALFFRHRMLLQELQNKGNSIAENKDYR